MLLENIEIKLDVFLRISPDRSLADVRQVGHGERPDLRPCQHPGHFRIQRGIHQVRQVTDQLNLSEVTARGTFVENNEADF